MRLRRTLNLALQRLTLVVFHFEHPASMFGC